MSGLVRNIWIAVRQKCLLILGLNGFSPLSLSSGENEVSLYISNTCSDIRVMGVGEAVARDGMS